MIRRVVPFVLTAMLTSILAGCGGDAGPSISLAEAGGTVTYKGAPLADATVTFVPENGPVATGVTDLSGKFKLSTGSRPGAAVGECRVTVSAVQGGSAKPAGVDAASGTPSGQAEGEARAKAMMEMQRKIAQGGQGAAEVLSGPKSVIPEKYAKPDTSNLKFKVESDASKNQFKIELND